MRRMSLVNMTTKKKVIIITSSILGTIALLAGTFFIYTGIYYHADDARIDTYIKDKDMDLREIGHKKMEFVPRHPTSTGIIFYPGAKVEYTAYRPLMASLADQGYTCVLAGMPFNLAFFGADKADGISERYPNIRYWYMMGHSVGGVVASQYITKHLGDYDGLIMLGAYPDRDLSESSLSYLSIYGSEDRVLNTSKYNDAKSKWPSNNKEYVINGGCHAGFAMYGTQKGDGTPSITTEEQIDITTSVIVDFLK